MIRALGIPIVWYPGGNFVSNYNWEDGVGPRGARSLHLDLDWRTMEPKAFGLDEFMDWYCGQT